MATKTVPSIETVEVMAGEVDEWYAGVRKIRQKMSRLKVGQ